MGVNLGKPGYLEEVKKQTADIDVSIVFCNAGYMLTGFFDSMCVLSSLKPYKHTVRLCAHRHIFVAARQQTSARSQ